MRSDKDEALRILARTVRREQRTRRYFARVRFLFAPGVEKCLAMLAQLEDYFGSERRAAAVIGPSLITLRSWKRRKTMSVPSRRLVWLVWAIVLHREQIETVDDLIAGNRS